MEISSRCVASDNNMSSRATLSAAQSIRFAVQCVADNTTDKSGMSIFLSTSSWSSRSSSRQPSSSTALPLPRCLSPEAISPEKLAPADHQSCLHHPRIHHEPLEQLQTISWFPHHFTARPTTPMDVGKGGLPWLSPINNLTRARPLVLTPILSMMH